MNPNHYRTMLIISLGMLMAIVMTSITFISLKMNEGIVMNMDYSDPIVMVGGIIGIITIPAGLLFYKSQLTKAKQKVTEEEKLTAYRSLFIIRSAIWEIGMLFNLIVFFMLNTWVPLFFSAGVLVMFVMHLPTEMRVKSDLEIS